MSDRRISFFLTAAIACFLLIPVAPEEFRWVAKVVGAVYVILAGLVTLELVGRRRRDGDRSP